MMLTDQELENVFAWKPYRADWPIDNKDKDQTILRHYGNLIKEMNKNKVFECTQTQAGDITNYLEFMCYPPVAESTGDQQGVLVCISLCSPLVAYGETMFKKDKKSLVYAFLIPEQTGIIKEPHLKPIETEIKTIINKYDLQIISNAYASKPLPEALASSLDSLNFGSQVLHGIFQWRSEV
jgi:hypothetical protein